MVRVQALDSDRPPIDAAASRITAASFELIKVPVELLWRAIGSVAHLATNKDTHEK